MFKQGLAQHHVCAQRTCTAPSLSPLMGGGGGSLMSRAHTQEGRERESPPTPKF